MTPSARSTAALLLVGLAGACGGAPVVGGAPLARRDAGPGQGALPGLVETGRASIDLRTGASPHLGRLVVHGANAYVANSFDGITAFQLGAEGSVSLVGEQRMAAGVPRCTTIALHAASSTLFCAAADRTGPALGETTSPVVAYALGGPAVFALRDAAVARVDFFIAALHVQGDRLLFAAFDHGLFQATITADGSLGAVTALRDSGDAVGLAGDGELLAQLDRDVGLRLWHVTAGAVEPEGAAVALDGPPLAVTVEGATVGVALGSQGAAVYTASPTGPALQARLHPPCSVMAVALHDDLAAVLCLDGLYLYAWRDDPTHLRGFAPTETASLDVTFSGDALVASDWVGVASFRADRAGESLCPLLPRGRYVRPGEDVSLPLVNPGAVPLYVEFSLVPPGIGAAGALAPVALAPGASAELRIPAAMLGRSDTPTVLHARAREARGTADARVTLRVATAGDTAPAIGASFPPLESDEGAAPRALPLAGRAQLIVFNNDTCVALWPELQDLAWLARHPRGPDDLAVALVSNRNPEFVASWRLEPLATLVRSDSYTLYEREFRVDGIPGAWHTEYFVDARGVVSEAARVYAGPSSPVGGFPALSR